MGMEPGAGRVWVRPLVGPPFEIYESMLLLSKGSQQLFFLFFVWGSWLFNVYVLKRIQKQSLGI